MSGDTAVARDWILGLPAGTWFTVPSVPAPKQVVNNLLARMLADDWPVIGKMARGLYWRQHPPASGLHGYPPIRDAACLSAAAPAGSGYAEWNALFALGWSTQGPVRTIVAVPYRNLVPPSMPTRGDHWAYLHRPNQRRRDLNWNEATLLEGALSFGGSGLSPWKRVVGRLLDGECYLKAHTPIHMDRVLWAAEAEKPLSKWPAGEGDFSFHAVINRLASDLPDVISV